MTVNTAAGGKIVMMHRFDAGKALQVIQDEKIQSIGGVPTIAMQILDHPDFHKAGAERRIYDEAPPVPREITDAERKLWEQLAKDTRFQPRS